MKLDTLPVVTNGAEGYWRLALKRLTDSAVHRFMFITFIVSISVTVVMVVLANDDDGWLIRVLVTECLFVLGIVYYYVQKQIPTFVKALIVMAAGVWNNFYQLGQLKNHVGQHEVYERLLFIVLGVGAIGEAFKHLVSEFKKDGHKHPRTSTPQSNVSWATPNPGSQVPE